MKIIGISSNETSLTCGLDYAYLALKMKLPDTKNRTFAMIETQVSAFPLRTVHNSNRSQSSSKFDLLIF